MAYPVAQAHAQGLESTLPKHQFALPYPPLEVSHARTTYFAVRPVCSSRPNGFRSALAATLPSLREADVAAAAAVSL